MNPYQSVPLDDRKTMLRSLEGTRCNLLDAIEFRREFLNEGRGNDFDKKAMAQSLTRDEAELARVQTIMTQIKSTMEGGSFADAMEAANEDPQGSDRNP